MRIFENNCEKRGYVLDKKQRKCQLANSGVASRDPSMTSAQSKRFSRILVAEDGGPNRRLLCELLESDGYETTVVATVPEALGALGENAFDAVVVGGRLADLSGLELLGRIQAQDDQLPVIFRAGAREFIEKANQGGAFACVTNLDDPGESLREVHLACRQRFDRYTLDLEAAVQERTEELARSNRELADFAAVVAHDLRSPLLTISGYCHVLRDDYQGRLDAAADGYLNAIVEGVARMNRLIENLLDYSRLNSSPEPLKAVDLGPVLVQVQANLGALISDNDARITVGPMPAVKGDPTQLAQLFQNLIGNAIQFRREPPPEITVSSAPEGDGHLLRVADNGIGIDPEHFETVFQVFQRLPTSRRHGGTGIGLAICKKIVERHGGRIWIESEPGRGSTVHLTLPNAEKNEPGNSRGHAPGI
jgi:signal transduction histidine kinase